MNRFFLLTIALLFSSPAFTQLDFPSLSPAGSIHQQVGNTHISLRYERPSARNRVIFGGLVPYDQVWRTGAGYCTRITFDKPVIFGGQSVKAGTYSLFTIPCESADWTVILNTDTTLYGAYDYDITKDVARTFASPQQSTRYYETLTADLDLVPNNTNLVISWTHTSISVFIETSTDQEIMTYIEEELLTGNVTTADNYASAADHLWFANKENLLAIELTERALELDPQSAFAASVQAELYLRIDRKQDAIASLEALIDAFETRTYDEEKYRARDIQQVRDRIEAIRDSMDE